MRHLRGELDFAEELLARTGKHDPNLSLATQRVDELTAEFMQAVMRYQAVCLERLNYGTVAAHNDQARADSPETKDTPSP